MKCSGSFHCSVRRRSDVFSPMSWEARTSGSSPVPTPRHVTCTQPTFERRTKRNNAYGGRLFLASVCRCASPQRRYGPMCWGKVCFKQMCQGLVTPGKTGRYNINKNTAHSRLASWGCSPPQAQGRCSWNNKIPFTVHSTPYILPSLTHGGGWGVHCLSWENKGKCCLLPQNTLQILKLLCNFSGCNF